MDNLLTIKEMKAISEDLVRTVYYLKEEVKTLENTVNTLSVDTVTNSQQITLLNQQIVATNERIDQLETELEALQNNLLSYTVHNFEITVEDWDSATTYTLVDNSLSSANLNFISPTIDGETVEGHVVTNNAINCGTHELQPSKIITNGQIVFSVNQTPTMPLYVTVVVYKRGD